MSSTRCNRCGLGLQICDVPFRIQPHEALSREDCTDPRLQRSLRPICCCVSHSHGTTPYIHADESKYLGDCGLLPHFLQTTHRNRSSVEHHILWVHSSESNACLCIVDTQLS